MNCDYYLTNFASVCLISSPRSRLRCPVEERHLLVAILTTQLLSSPTLLPLSMSPPSLLSIAFLVSSYVAYASAETTAVVTSPAITRCPPGWTLYEDDGSEGADSCFAELPNDVSLAVNGFQWRKDACATPAHPNAHLMTVSSRHPASFGGTGLLSRFLLSPNTTSFGAFGCFNSKEAGGLRSAGSWAWIDGSAAENLRVGSVSDNDSSSEESEMEYAAANRGLWFEEEPQ